VESETDFLICCDLGKEKKEREKGKGGVSGREWEMEREVLTQHSTGSGEWKGHEIMKSVRFG
jgi:hypothetical protein